MQRLIAASTCLLLLLACEGGAWAGQGSQAPSGTLRVSVDSNSGPVAGAIVRVGSQKAIAAADGIARLTLPAGDVRVTIEAAGFLSHTVPAVVTLGRETLVDARLVAQPTVTEEVIVSATRSEKRLADEPLRVEVLDRDEIEEKLLMTPGDIAMLLNETAGLRVQVTSPGLGAASLRVQGLRGRYTQLLSDGLPLYGGQSGSIGLLQIPPMDLGRVEIIKGVASSLFGASALGGVINLVSRQPGLTADREVLLNQTTLGGTDAMLWMSGPMASRWGYTLLAGVDHQKASDVDADGWADISGFSRLNVRPRLFWNNGEGRSVFFTAGVMAENRAGGTVDGRTVPDGSSFTESIDSRRFDTGVVARLLVGQRVLGLRGSATVQTHAQVFGDANEDDRHATGFGEVSLTSASGPHTWVIGGAVQSDGYRAHDVPRFNHTDWVPSVFAQDDYTVSPHVALSLSARLDQHSRLGTFLSPRASALIRGGAWTLRLSGGGGYFAPTALTDETEAAGLTRLTAVRLDRAEQAQSYSADLSRSFGPIELNATAFGSRVSDPLAPRSVAGVANRYELVPLSGATRTAGFEGLAKVNARPFALVATYTYVHATEPDAVTGARLDVALTPRHASGVVAMWEREGVGRAGVEFYYTGRQRLDNNPYRAESAAYPYVGFMGERRIGGRLRLFINAENLTDRRQTRFDSLIRPTRNFDGRWTVDAWAPLDGRTANAGFRWSF